LNDFLVKDSGSRQSFDSGMVRDTQDGKPLFGLIVASDVPYEEQMLHRFAMHMTKASVKYGPRNWEKSNSIEEMQRFKESGFRHFLQWYFDERDEDHASAVWFNITAAERLRYKLETS
jgi:hypothetical protein